MTLPRACEKVQTNRDFGSFSQNPFGDGKWLSKGLQRAQITFLEPEIVSTTKFDHYNLSPESIFSMQYLQSHSLRRETFLLLRLQMPRPLISNDRLWTHKSSGNNLFALNVPKSLKELFNSVSHLLMFSLCYNYFLTFQQN